MTVSIVALHAVMECHNAECCIFRVLLGVVMLGAVLLSVILLSVIALSKIHKQGAYLKAGTL